MRHTTELTIVAVVIAILLLVGGFWAGVRYNLSAERAPLSAQPQSPGPVAFSLFGQVAAKSPTSITLKLTDGTTQTFSVASTTTVYTTPAPVTLNSVTVGATISATLTGSSTPAQSINIVPPPPSASISSTQ